MYIFLPKDYAKIMYVCFDGCGEIFEMNNDKWAFVRGRRGSLLYVDVEKKDLIVVKDNFQSLNIYKYMSELPTAPKISRLSLSIENENSCYEGRDGAEMGEVYGDAKLTHINVDEDNKYAFENPIFLGCTLSDFGIFPKEAFLHFKGFDETQKLVYFSIYFLSSVELTEEYFPQFFYLNLDTKGIIKVDKIPDDLWHKNSETDLTTPYI